MFNQERMNSTLSESSAYLGYLTGEESEIGSSVGNHHDLHHSSTHNTHRGSIDSTTNNTNNVVVDNLPMDFPGVRPSKLPVSMTADGQQVLQNSGGMIDWESVDGSLDFMGPTSERSRFSDEQTGQFRGGRRPRLNSGDSSSLDRSGNNTRQRRRGTGDRGGGGGNSSEDEVSMMEMEEIIEEETYRDYEETTHGNLEENVMAATSSNEEANIIHEENNNSNIQNSNSNMDEQSIGILPDSTDLGYELPDDMDLGYEDPDESFNARKLNLSDNNSGNMMMMSYSENSHLQQAPPPMQPPPKTKADLGYEDLGYEDPEVYFQKTNYNTASFHKSKFDYDNNNGDDNDDDSEYSSSSSDEDFMLESDATRKKKQRNTGSHSTSGGPEGGGMVRRASLSAIINSIGIGASVNRRTSAESQSSMDDSSVEFAYSTFYEFIQQYLPSWCICIPSCSGTAICVAQYAPCFWFYNCICFGNNGSLYSQQRRQGGTTDHLVLSRLNILCSMFTLVHIAAALWLIIVMLWPNIVDRRTGDKQHSAGLKATDGLEPNFWSINGTMFSVGLLGLFIFVANIVSIRVIHVVNLRGTIRYLWIMLWAIPFELFLVISLYDYHNVTEVWITHWWTTPAMAWFRDHHCIDDVSNATCRMLDSHENETYRCTKCMVPYSNDTQDEIEWCQYNFNNSTDCTEIRNDAQDSMLYIMQVFYMCNATWGVLLLLLLLLIVNTLEKIITRPIVQKSRESNVPAWLLVPIFGCACVGSVLRYSPSSLVNTRAGTDENSWVGVAYMFCTALFLIAAALGWFISGWTVLSSRDKRYKNISLTIFIIIIVINASILAGIFAASLYYSIDLSRYQISEELRGPLACTAGSNAHSCSNCEEYFNSLEEDEDDSTAVVVVIMDESGSEVFSTTTTTITMSSSSSSSSSNSISTGVSTTAPSSELSFLNNNTTDRNIVRAAGGGNRRLGSGLSRGDNRELFDDPNGIQYMMSSETEKESREHEDNHDGYYITQEEILYYYERNNSDIAAAFANATRNTMNITNRTNTTNSSTADNNSSSITELDDYNNYYNEDDVDNDVVLCPEWSLSDVTRILQTQSKQSATLAGIFFLYAVTALRFGFILRKHLAMYQIEYV